MKKILLGLTILGLAVAPAVLAQGTGGLKAGTATLPDLATDALFTTLDNIANLVFGLLLAVAAIFIVIAAYDFVTAAGDAEKVNTARMYVIYALMGIIVAYLARSLIKYVATLTG